MLLYNLRFDWRKAWIWTSSDLPDSVVSQENWKSFHKETHPTFTAVELEINSSHTVANVVAHFAVQWKFMHKVRGFSLLESNMHITGWRMSEGVTTTRNWHWPNASYQCHSTRSKWSTVDKIQYEIETFYKA